MSFKAFSKAVGIPHGTLQSRVHLDAKRTSLGASVGRPPLVKPKVQQYVVDVIRRRDRGNAALTSREAVDLVMEVAPSLSRQQADLTLRRTIRKNHRELTLRRTDVTKKAHK